MITSRESLQKFQPSNFNSSQETVSFLRRRHCPLELKCRFANKDTFKKNINKYACFQEMNVRIEGQEVGKVEEIPTWWNQVVNVHDQAGNKVRHVRHNGSTGLLIDLDILGIPY